VIVTLEEGDRHRLSLGAGYDTEDGVRGLFGYSLANLFGQGVSLDIDTVVAQREELYRLLLLKPGVGWLPFPVRFTVFSTREDELNLSEAFEGDVVVEQAGLQLGADLSYRGLAFPLLYTYKRVDNNVPLGQEIDDVFPREKSKVHISSLTAGLQVDRRDSPIQPSTGRNTVLQVEYAFPFLNTDEDFVKVFVQQTKDLDLDSLGVLGSSLRLGGIESLRGEIEEGSGSGEGCSSDVVPDFGVALSERFFAGGRTTHRAYELDTLGIVGETLFVTREEVDGSCSVVGHFASGGNGLALFNLDYRYPFLPGFWATVFFDSGNVWQDWRDITLSELKHGVGAGLGWDSPIGPLRLEVGWKHDSESF
jgi:outer membrane protein assembly factor BamA